MKRILISPLDWGLGHATRCVPLIRLLLDTGAKVFIAGEGRSLELLKGEFPSCEFLDLPGYGITYPEQANLAMHMLFSIPHILSGIKREHRKLQDLIREHRIDLVISDNRYGLFSELMPTVLITHQVFIKTPFGKRLLESITRNYIRRFTECWIPDEEGTENLSGDLSHLKPLGPAYHFIGPLSRMGGEIPVNTDLKKDFVVVISGPEPQRTFFEKRVLDQVGKLSQHGVVVLGKVDGALTYSIGNAEVIGHLPSRELQKLIVSADVVISRPGYSSILDMASVGKKCIFIPTPGQTEQEYLASYHREKGHCLVQEQEEMNLGEALEKAEDIPGFKKRAFGEEVLKSRIQNLIGES